MNLSTRSLCLPLVLLIACCGPDGTADPKEQQLNARVIRSYQVPEPLLEEVRNLINDLLWQNQEKGSNKG